MDGSSLLFGAVGAMPGIKNPVLVAKLLVREQQKGLLPLGRVPPGFLVGEGARNWAIRHGVASVSSESLISEKANKLYRYENLHYLIVYNRLHFNKAQKSQKLHCPTCILGEVWYFLPFNSNLL